MFVRLLCVIGWPCHGGGGGTSRHSAFLCHATGEGCVRMACAACRSGCTCNCRDRYDRGPGCWPEGRDRAIGQIARRDRDQSGGRCFLVYQDRSAAMPGFRSISARPWRRRLGVPVEYVEHDTSGQITEAASKGSWDVSFLPKDGNARPRCRSAQSMRSRRRPISSRQVRRSKNFATLDQEGTEVAAVKNTTTMRGAQAHLKKATVTGYDTYARRSSG